LRITALCALMRKCLRAAASASAAPARVLGMGGDQGVEAQENKSLHLKSLLRSGVTRWWLGHASSDY